MKIMTKSRFNNIGLINIVKATKLCYFMAYTYVIDIALLCL